MGILDEAAKKKVARASAKEKTKQRKKPLYIGGFFGKEDWLESCKVGDLEYAFEPLWSRTHVESLSGEERKQAGIRIDQA